MSGPTKKDIAKAKLWKKGVLNWKLDDNQREMYDFAMNSTSPFVVISASRQIGKSFFLFTIASEVCYREPNKTVIIVAPKLKQIKRISQARMSDIAADCPDKSMLPKFRTNDHYWQFPNGSRIYIAGTDNENYDSIRGLTADLCIIDEAGFCTNLNHIINSILVPTTTTTGGKIILSSTPPMSMDHDFILYMKQAIKEGTFIQRTIYDNPRLKESDINRLANAAGGFDSPDFQREYLCEMKTDSRFAIVPEFPDVKDKIVSQWDRPDFFETYTCMDIGGNDITAILFSYYDFKRGTVIIEDELSVQGQEHTVDWIASEIKRKEEKLWNGKPVYKRVADNNNLILLNDLAIKHKISFHATDKDDKIAAINNLRMMIKTKKFIINPRCVNLIDHLENGIWNKAKSKFARSADKGHYDFVDAAIYLCRNIDFHRNPFPDEYVGGDDQFVTPHYEKQEVTQTARTIKGAFANPFLKKRRRY